MGQRGTAGVVLEGVPDRGASLASRHGPQPIELLAAFRTQGVIDLRVEAAVDLGTASLGLFLEGREPWQLKPLSDEFLDGDVDDVRQILLGLSSLPDSAA
jgi:hypothetical protein